MKYFIKSSSPADHILSHMCHLASSAASSFFTKLAKSPNLLTLHWPKEAQRVPLNKVLLGDKNNGTFNWSWKVSFRGYLPVARALNFYKLFSNLSPTQLN